MFIIKQSRWLKVSKTHRILWKQGSRQRGDFPLSLSPQWWRTLLQFRTLSTPWLCSSTLRKERGGHYMRGEISPQFRPVLAQEEWSQNGHLEKIWFYEKKRGLRRGGGKLASVRKAKLFGNGCHVTHVTEKLRPTRILGTTWPRSFDPRRIRIL